MPLYVQYAREQALDYGGPVQEWMNNAWRGQGVGEEYFFIGKLLGIALKQGLLYGGEIDIGMCVAITNYPVTIEFIKMADLELYRSLKFIE